MRVLSGDRGGQGVGPCFPIHLLHPKTDEHVNPSVEVRHFVGNLSTAENLLSKVPTCPGKYLLKWWTV
jgi:hypothetical protein